MDGKIKKKSFLEITVNIASIVIIITIVKLLMI